MAPSCRERASLDFGQALGVAGAITVAGGLWLYAVGRRLPPGWGRLAAAAPVVAANLLLPLQLFCRWEECTTILLVSFNTSWIASFKALSWALDRGALCMQPGGFPLPQFLAVYASPITPAVSGRGTSKGAMPRRGSQGRLEEDAGGPLRMVASWLAKNVLVAVAAGLLQLDLPGLAESFVSGLALYCLLSLIMDGPAALVIGLTGLRVSPHFDRPWLATSVAGFWSKRWDLAAGNTLRQLVYDIIVDGSLLPPLPGKARRPSAARQALGVVATFGASGLIHEAILWLMAGRTTGGAWLAFFLLQALLIVAERLALAALKRRGISPPDWARRAVTYLLLLATGQHLFWLPSKRLGVNDCITGNTRDAAVAGWRRLGVTLPI